MKPATKDPEGGVKLGERFQLDDDFCKAVPHPEKGQRLYFDSHKNAPRGFALRVTAGAKSWVLNYVVDGHQRRMTLRGYPAWSPDRARKEAAKIRDAVNAGRDPLGEQRRQHAEEIERAAAKHAAAHRTLGALLSAYCDHLQAQQRPSAHDVRGLIHLHIRDANAKLWATPAADIQPEDGRTILAKLTRAKKLRTAGKLRSYLRAAFSLGIKARLDSGLSDALAELAIRENPMRDLPVSEGFAGKRRDRYLRVEELRAYWQRIAAMPGADGALLRFHLLSGGQRIEQLSRATRADLSDDAIVLRDGKGRRKRDEPRMHMVPLIPAAVEALQGMRGAGPFVFSVDGGRSGAGYFAVEHRLQKIVADMRAADELQDGTFTPGDIRRTVETLLAELKFPPHVRAQLQSHGLTGVQLAHYDKYSYADEKREALNALYQLASDKGATVTPISAGRAKRRRG